MPIFVENITWTNASNHMLQLNGKISSMVIDVMVNWGSFLFDPIAFVASQPVSKINIPKATKPTEIIDRRNVLLLYVL